MENNKAYYELGKRDAVALILMKYRANNLDAKKTLREVALELPDNVHAKFILNEKGTD